MTSLLNGQAVNVALCSTSVTTRRGSRRFKARAQVAPAKPPPTTTTRPAEPWARAGRNGSAVQAISAICCRMRRRVVCPAVIVAALIGLRRVPRRDGRDLGLGEALGDAVHHGCLALSRAKVSQRRDGLRRRAA